MIRWRAFERRMRRLVKRRVKASPRLKAQAAWSLSDLRLPGWCSTGLLMVLVYSKAISFSKGTLLALAAVSLVQTGVAVLFAAGMVERLYNNDVAIAMLHPIPDRLYFDWKWRSKGIIRGVLFVLINVGVYALLFCNTSGFRSADRLLLSGMACVYAVCALLVLLPPILLIVKSKMIIKSGIVGIILVFIAMFFSHVLSADEDTLQHTLLIVFPVGWLNSTFDPTLRNLDLMLVAVGCVLAGMIPVNIILYRALADSFVLPEYEEIEEAEIEADEDYEEELEEDAGGYSKDKITDTEAEPSGLVYRCICALLTAEEKELLNYLQPLSELWDISWKNAVRNAVIAVVFMQVLPNTYWVIPVALLFWACARAMPFLGGAWQGLEIAAWSPGVTFMHALMPVDPRAAYKVILKVNLVRMFLWLPLICIATAACAWLGNDRVVIDTLLIAAGVFIVTSWQPVVVACRMTGWCSESKSTSFHSLLHMVAALFWIVFFVGLAGGFMFGVVRSDWKAACGLLLPILSYITAEIMYHNTFIRNRGDLTYIPQEE